MPKLDKKAAQVPPTERYYGKVSNYFHTLESLSTDKGMRDRLIVSLDDAIKGCA